MNELMNAKLSVANGFLLNQLGELVHVYNKSMRIYDISKASDAVLKFYWDILCDYYVEIVKPIISVENSKYEAEEIRVTKLVLFAVLD